MYYKCGITYIIQAHLQAIGEVDHPALILRGPPFVFNKGHRQRRRSLGPRHGAAATARQVALSTSQHKHLNLLKTVRKRIYSYNNTNKFD